MRKSVYFPFSDLSVTFPFLIKSKIYIQLQRCTNALTCFVSTPCTQRYRCWSSSMQPLSHDEQHQTICVTALCSQLSGSAVLQHAFFSPCFRSPPRSRAEVSPAGRTRGGGEARPAPSREPRPKMAAPADRRRRPPSGRGR